MNKQIIGLVVITLLLSSSGVSLAEDVLGTSKKIVGEGAGNEKDRERLNQEQNMIVELGSATIVGDGINESSYVIAEAWNEIMIRTENETSNVDFSISYSMICEGLTDSGLILLTIQLNGVQKGHNEVYTVENETGDLIIENVTVTWTDILTYEISAIYANLIPSFTKPIVVIGGGIVIPKSKGKEKRTSIIFSNFRQTNLINSFQGTERNRWDIVDYKYREIKFLNVVSVILSKNDIINTLFQRVHVNNPCMVRLMQKNC